MMRIRLVVACVLFAGTIVRAEVGGYRLVTTEGTVQGTPEGIIASAPWADVMAAPSETVFESSNLMNVLSKLVGDSERTVRKGPGAYASLLQRHEFIEIKRKELTQLVEHLPLTRATLSLTVIDVRRRVGNINAESGPPGELPYLVIGQLKQSTMTIFTKEDRDRISQMNAAAEKGAREMIEARQRDLRGRSVTGAEAQAFELQVRQRRDQGRKEVQDLKDRSEARKPIHMVYLFTDDKRVIDWKKGQTRPATGVIQSVGLFLYDPPAASGGGAPAANDLNTALGSVEGIEDMYVGAEFVMRSFGPRAATGAPLGQRKEEPSSIGKPTPATND